MSTVLNLESVSLPADAIEVGRIADAWGVKGWFKVISHNATPDALFAAKNWYIQPSERGARTFTGTAALVIRQVRPHSDTIVAWAQGIDERDTAEALRGARIFVPRSAFPVAQDDEYYWVDLIGLDVFNREGVALGQVRELLATGPQTVLVLEAENPENPTGKPVERMIPFVAAFIDKVELPQRRILVDWQLDY